MEKYGTAREATDDNILRRMRMVCWVTKAAYTHSEYVILIAFARQQWLHECTSVLRYTYSLVKALIECRETIGVGVLLNPRVS